MDIKYLKTVCKRDPETGLYIAVWKSDPRGPGRGPGIGHGNTEAIGALVMGTFCTETGGEWDKKVLHDAIEEGMLS